MPNKRIKYKRSEIYPDNGRMQIITINVPKVHLQLIEIFLNEATGIFPSRSELIRAAIKDYLDRQIKKMEKINQLIKEKEQLTKEGKIKIDGTTYNIRRLDKYGT